LTVAFSQIQLEGDAVAVGKDLVALFFQQLGQRVVSAAGDGGADIASLSNTASQVPMPSGTFSMYLV